MIHALALLASLAAACGSTPAAIERDGDDDLCATVHPGSVTRSRFRANSCALRCTRLSRIQHGTCPAGTECDELGLCVVAGMAPRDERACVRCAEPPAAK